MRKILSTLSILAVLVCFGQNSKTAGPSSNGLVTNIRYVPSIAEQLENGTFIPADNRTVHEAPPKRRGANKSVPGKGYPKGDDPLRLLQETAIKYQSKEPLLVFDADQNSNIGVTDPTGCVGPNHYLAAWNFGFRIFDKDGNPLVPEASLGTVLTNNTLGDPIVLYDKWADRYIITEFDASPNGFEMAISEGPDPVNDGWFVYQAQFTTGSFPDYTKFSIWSDGYYVTANVNNGANGDRVWVVERDEMLDGNPVQYVGFPLTGIATSGFYSPQAFNVTGGDLPAAGDATIVYLQDDAWGGISDDHLKLWTIDVDWGNIANSTISGPEEIVTEDFTSVFDGGSFSNFEQPTGPDVDGLQATVMNQAQFRKFPTYNSAVFNFLVDADGTAGETGAIRWYELRQDADGEPWSIYQEGTYVSTNEKDAFSASMAMDESGNIGMAYTTVSSTESIAIQYTGRYAADPLGVMTVEETLIAQGSNDCPGNRLADYVHLTVDPEDEKTFWHIAEYHNPGRDNVVGVFKLAPDFNTDVGVISVDAPVNGTLGAAEAVTITVRNYGIDEQSNVPVSYQIDGGTPQTGTVPGPIASGANVQYTFAQTGDFSVQGQTYMISATTSLSGDEDTSNDATVSDVTHLDPNDLGVTSIDAPVSSTDLTGSEAITVTIQNFGGEAQSGFDVAYTINAGAPIIENVADILEGDTEMSYTFSETGDFSQIGDYEITAYTSLPSDSDPSNDSSTETVTKQFCQPQTNCTLGDGIVQLILSNIDNNSGCDPDGYGDYTDLTVNLDQGTTYDLTITTEYGSQYVVAWIDMNDNFVFEDEEVVVDNYVIADGQGGGSYTETMDLVVPVDATLGEHIMRVKTNWNNPVPTDACEETTYGETEDYTANIGSVGLNESYLGDGEMIISTFEDDRFNIRFVNETLNKDLIIAIYNTSGQVVAQNWVYPVNGVYEYDLDMSYATPGAYLIRLGDQQGGKVKRIIVR
ncbi:MAG: T9SS type A sorting domain-containing protein [Flavobacteriales bacterium]|nr:T9SS type A sorting domain-containing protein [Flavobacteriales bacterium]